MEGKEDDFRYGRCSCRPEWNRVVGQRHATFPALRYPT
ncbi:MAG: hypothetical protein QOK36_3682, partial [Gaiellales bacterium]|nr:hypothetical protein [Gaiellales bacterium]